MNWKKWKKECKQDQTYVLCMNSNNEYKLTTQEEYESLTLSKGPCFCAIVKSKNYDLLTCFHYLLYKQDKLKKYITKYIDDSMPKGHVDRLTIGNNTFINEPLITSTIPTTEDIRNMIEDPNIFYAVQGNYPNIAISKYEKVAEDSFNYCLRQKEGNLALLPKTVCFNSKADAIIYQNDLIQKYSQEKLKKK